MTGLHEATNRIAAILQRHGMSRALADAIAAEIAPMAAGHQAGRQEAFAEAADLAEAGTPDWSPAGRDEELVAHLRRFARGEQS